MKSITMSMRLTKSKLKLLEPNKNTISNLDPQGHACVDTMLGRVPQNRPNKKSFRIIFSSVLSHSLGP